MTQYITSAFFLILFAFLIYMRIKIQKILRKGKEIRDDLLLTCNRFREESEKCKCSPGECPKGIPEQVENLRLELNKSITLYNQSIENKFIKLFLYLTNTEMLEKIPHIERSQYEQF